MTQEEVYGAWAPASAVWSPWVAPVIFAHLPLFSAEGDDAVAPEVSWADEAGGCAVILDLPGADCISTGIGLMNHGFRPVPVINAVPGPAEISLGLTRPVATGAVIDMVAIVNAMLSFTELVRRAPLAPNAPPVFLLDSQRIDSQAAPEEGSFDNRWIVIPQDFPSAEFLSRQGISKVLLVQQDRLTPRDDLAHVLLRWQQRGIEIWGKRLDSSAGPERVIVKQPHRFKTAWYRVLAMAGLQRSSAGGFGSYAPETTGAG